MEFAELYRKDKVDPGWNKDMIKTCLKWVSKQMTTGLDSQTAAFYRPEQCEEESKQDAGWYAPDRVPTIDVSDIYAGYREAHGRITRLVGLGGLSSINGAGPGIRLRGVKNQSDGLMACQKRSRKVISFIHPMRIPSRIIGARLPVSRYGDLSAVFPAMHNSVRGLGWIVYSLCHIQNRLKSRFYDTVFEQLLQYFQVSSMDEVGRAMKIELANMGFLDESIKMVKAQDRWQPNAQFIELGLGQVMRDIQSNSKAWTQNSDAGNSKTEKTKFQHGRVAAHERFGQRGHEPDVFLSETTGPGNVPAFLPSKLT